MAQTLIILSSLCVVLTTVTTFGFNLEDDKALVVTGSPDKLESLVEVKKVKADPTAGAHTPASLKRSSRALSQGTVAAPYFVLPNLSPNQSEFTLLPSISTVALNDSTVPGNVSYFQQDLDGSKSNKKLGLTFQIAETAGLYDRRDGKRDKSADMELGISYKTSEKTAVLSKVTGSIDQNDYENNDMGSASIGLYRDGIDFLTAQSHRHLLTLAPFFSVGLPISKAHKEQSYRGGLSPGLRLSLGEDLLPSKRLSVGIGLKVSRNFYSFEQSVSGKSNSQYSSSQSLDVGYQLPADFSLSLNLSHFNSWTFQGNPGESFSHSEELGYKLSKSFALALGHQFGSPAASIYKADGQTSNFNLVNEDDSYVYSAITYTY